MKKDLKDRLKKIDDFFDNLTPEEFEEMALECGMDKESPGRIMFDVKEEYMDEQVAIAFFKQDVAWLKTELKEPVGIKTMMSALESRVCAEELAIEALNERMERGWISVSERLPSGEVVACSKQGYETIGRVFYDEESVTDYSAESDHEHMYDVIAWMPLPKPYKEDMNE